MINPYYRFGLIQADADDNKFVDCAIVANAEYLVSNENLVRFGCKAYDLNLLNLRVYIKNAADYDEVKATVDELYPQIPAVYTIADVCRDELLVEIEGILIS